MSEFDRVVTDLLAPHDLRYTAGRRALVAALARGRSARHPAGTARDVGRSPAELRLSQPVAARRGRRRPPTRARVRPCPLRVGRGADRASSPPDLQRVRSRRRTSRWLRGWSRRSTPRSARSRTRPGSSRRVTSSTSTASAPTVADRSRRVACRRRASSTVRSGRCSEGLVPVVVRVDTFVRVTPAPASATPHVRGRRTG